MNAAVSGRPTDFAVLLPPGWVRLPVGPGARAAVARLVSARFGQLPPDQRERVRRDLREQILAAVEDAERAGGIEVLLCVDPVAGKPVSGSCLVAFVPGRGGQPEFGPLLAELHADDATWTPVEVNNAPAARRSLRETHNDGGDGLTSTRVDYLVPVPGSDAQLLLSFATVTEQVAAELTSLFDAIAGSLRWVYGA